MMPWSFAYSPLGTKLVFSFGSHYVEKCDESEKDAMARAQKRKGTCSSQTGGGSQKDEVREGRLRPRRHAHYAQPRRSRTLGTLRAQAHEHAVPCPPFTSTPTKDPPTVEREEVPHCAAGTSDKLTNDKGTKGWAYRCRAKGCQRYV